MSLIMGLHLLERCYLISDTRATSIRNKSDIYIVRDNLIKAFNFNQRISALAAGDALPASYILNKLKEKITTNSTISDLKKIIISDIRNIISDYVNNFGYHVGDVAYIFAGYNLEKNKKVEVSLLGDAVSAMVIAAGKNILQNVLPQRNIVL